MSSYTSSILITGSTSGLGHAAALNLALSHPTTLIIITGRTPNPDPITLPNTLYIPLDLSSHLSTRNFLTTYLTHTLPPISALILNAGYQVVDQVRYSPDNLEIMFAINHVNHALLFYLMAPYLTTTARVIVVSSSTHDPKFKRVPPPNYTTANDAAHPPTGKEYNTQPEAFRRYALSKLCNILFTYSLHTHAQKHNKQWIITALDPGVMPTKLYRWATGITGYLFNWVLSSRLGSLMMADLFTTEFVAESLSRMAVDEEFGRREMGGKYYQVVGCRELESSLQSHEVELQEELWKWTIGEVAGDDGEKRKFDELDF